MRINVQQVFKSWLDGKVCTKSQSISTDGSTIYSYRTPIVSKRDDGTIEFNATRYSVTTSTQQGALRVLLTRAGLSYVEA